MDYGLLYRQVDGVKLEGFKDADWTRGSIDRKSTSYCTFNVRSGTISRFTRKQRSVAWSLVEVEYMFVSPTTCEAIWLRKLFVGLFGQRLEPTVIHCHNQSCIKLFDIQCSMTTPSTSRSCSTISKIVFRGARSDFNTFLQESRHQTY